MDHASVGLFGLMASFALAGAFAPAAAAEATRVRQVFFAGDASPLELASSYLLAHPGDGIEIISFTQPGKETTETFYGFGPVTRSPAGVCRFTSTQVFPHRPDDGTITWDRTPPNPREHAQPPYAMAAIAAAPCPRQSEEAYTTLDDGISDQDFLTISKFWKDISTSEEKFDEASVYLPLILSQRVAARFDAFRSAVFRPGAEHPQLRAVLSGGVGTYDLAFAASPSDAPDFFVTISKSGTGFQVLNFQVQY
jgi:hypothetical protein